MDILINMVNDFFFSDIEYHSIGNTRNHHLIYKNNIGDIKIRIECTPPTLTGYPQLPLISVFTKLRVASSLFIAFYKALTYSFKLYGSCLIYFSNQASSMSQNRI